MIKPGMKKILVATTAVAAFGAGGYFGFADSKLDIAGDSPRPIDRETVYQGAKNTYVADIGTITIRDRVKVLYFDPLDDVINGYNYDNGVIRVRKMTWGNGIMAIIGPLDGIEEQDFQFGDDCLKVEYDADAISTLSETDLAIAPKNATGVVLHFHANSSGVPLAADSETQAILDASQCNTGLEVAHHISQ